MGYVKVVVRTGEGTVSGTTFTDIVEEVERAIIYMDGWQKVRYKNRYYALRGGIRTEAFICLNNPLKPRIFGIQKTILDMLQKTELWLSIDGLHREVALSYAYVTLHSQTQSVVNRMCKRGILTKRVTDKGVYCQVAGKEADRV